MARLTAFRNVMREFWYSESNIIRNHVLMSLLLEVLLYLGMYYSGMVTVLLASLMFVKYFFLPGINLVTESSLIILLGVFEFSRAYLGMKGNVMHELLPLAASVGMTLPSFLVILYFMLWQTYVLRIEVVLTTVMIAMQGIQLTFGCICLNLIYAEISHRPVLFWTKNPEHIKEM